MNRYGSKCISCQTLSVFFLVLFGFVNRVLPQSDEEHFIWAMRIKATMIYKFIYYIEWPENLNSDSNNKIIVGVIGDATHYELLNQYHGRMINDQELVIKPINDVDQLTNCNVLFIGKEADMNLEKVKELIDHQPILIIGEEEQFTQRGGIINFFLDKQDRVQFEVNIDAAKLSGLKISSKLLKLAKFVYGKG